MSGRHIGYFLLTVAALTSTAAAQEAVSDRVLVRADRVPDAQAGAPFSVRVLEGETLRHAPQLRLDDLLRAQVPGFTLFRRSSSRTANPTTQGVTLRNFGPNGAGRTLVLLDGIPLNDPFAGYVLWNQAPPSALESVLVVPGGGAGLFGNVALAGTIFLVSKTADADAGFAEASLGNQTTYSASAGGTVVRGPVAVTAFAERFSTNGYTVVERGQRGRVDTNADSESNLIQLATEVQLSANASLRLQARRFDEERGNGTRYTRNDTVGSDASGVFTLRFPDSSSELRLSAYGQRRKFRSTFSSVNADRTFETPALDQYDVPANAVGGSAVWTTALATEHRITIGGDLRWIEGETNEAFRWDGTGFTRLRNAGGREFFAGVFAEDTWEISSRTTLVGGVRLDRWQLFDGFRRETERATGTQLLASEFADRDGFSLNGRLGARTKIVEQFSIRGAAYTGFRVPTLNELYRPFRVGNDVSEANAALEPERLLGIEAGIEWQPVNALRLTATGFVNRLEDAVGNITIGIGPGTFDPGGFIPEGGVLRQRQNVDLVLAPGAELTAEWQIAQQFLIRAGYLFTHPTIEEAADPTLEGNLLAQTPQHVFTALTEWRPTAKWLITAQMRYNGEQFEDDQNFRTLAAFTTVDAAIFYDFTDNLSAGVKAENLFNTEIETGKSATGLVSIGAPRLLTLQLRARL
ncbi:TonB-dependent receptor [soil metagenome]